MKKFILLVLVIIVLALIGISSYIYLNANALIAGLKPELEKIASSALGAPVKIGAINLGLGLSPSISVSQIAVGTEDAGSSAKNLSVANVLLSIDLVPLLSKELRVSKLAIENPRVFAIKTASELQIVGLPKRTAASKSPSQAQPQIPSQKAASLLSRHR